MDKKFKAVLLSILFVVFVQPMSGQLKSVYNLDMTDGISQNTVSAIYQDERNYIWFATRNGLNLYNGKNFTVFKNEKGNPGTLPNSQIKELCGDDAGHLFIRTVKGIILEADIHTFAHKVILPSKATSMCCGPDGLYCSLSHRILHQVGADFEEVFSFDDNRKVVTALCKTEDRLLIGTMRHGLYSLDETGTLESWIPEGYVTDILMDSYGDCWVTFQGNPGIARLSQHGERLPLQSEDDGTCPLEKARCCTEDKEGNIWIGTFRGLFQYDRKAGVVRKTDSPEFEKTSILSLMIDHQGTVWAGTYYQGVKYFNPEDQAYEIFRKSDDTDKSLGAETIGDLLEDGSGNIWIATVGGGLDCYLKPEDRVVHYSGQEGLLSENVRSIYLDEQENCIWIGTFLGGLGALDLQTGKIRNFVHRQGVKESLPSDTVRDIISFGNDLLLAVKGGVVLFDKVTGCCRPLFNQPEYRKQTHYISQLLIDSHDQLWLVHTSDGAFRYDLRTGHMESFQSETVADGKISPGKINSIFEDSKGRIWFCNNQNGLDMYDYETGSFRNFDIENSHLSSNALYAVAELDDDRLIVTTDNGYSILMIETNSSLNYLSNRAIPLLAANEGSLLVSSDRTVYIGGLNGLMAFDADHEILPRKDYEIKPFQLTIDGVPVRVNDASQILQEDFSVQDQIVIGPDVTSFSIEYAITDYLPFDKDIFYYCLEGNGNKWNRMDPSNTISFTHLSPGKYRLLVKSINDTEGTGKTHVLNLVVRPPFYQTGWAYLLYLVVIIGLLYTVFKIYSSRMRYREEEKLNQYKLSFFTQISHEFRTPLTVIIAQMEQMMDKYHKDKTIYAPLKRVYSSCIQLKYLISELLDFRKQEKGYMTLKVTPADWSDFIHEQFLNFQLFAKQKGFNYKFVDEAGSVSVWFDALQLQKVINNLIFNALKNVNDRGDIVVKTGADACHAWVEVRNTGKGLSQQEIANVFKPFYQTDYRKHDAAGTGIGLALVQSLTHLHHGEVTVSSIPGEETVFKVMLPLGHDHFQPEELQTDEVTSPALVDHVRICDAVLSDAPETHEDELQETHELALLIVEDEDALRATLRELFKPFYQVSEASNGQEGLQLMKKQTVDLVISDIMMPVMDGLEFCRHIKEDKSLNHIPVVLLTARVDDSQKLEGLKYGADDYILKPFNTRELVSRCNNIVRNHQLLRQKFSLQKNTRTSVSVETSTYQDQDFINKSRAIIASHITDKEFRVDDLAREMAVSRTYLFTRLRSILDQTPMEFIFDEHLREAERLLKEELDLNITEVAEKAGFSSSKVFRKKFREKYGVSPMAYRKSL